MSDNFGLAPMPFSGTSGLNIQPVQQGPLVSVLHTERKMRIFGITENELRTLTIVNAAMAALFALGSGCFGYLLNLDTAVAIAGGAVPPQTQAVIGFLRPGLTVLGFAFFFLGAVAWIMRSSFIGTIKRQSDPQLRQAVTANRLGRFGRAWDAFWS